MSHELLPSVILMIWSRPHKQLSHQSLATHADFHSSTRWRRILFLLHCIHEIWLSQFHFYCLPITQWVIPKIVTLIFKVLLYQQLVYLADLIIDYIPFQSLQLYGMDFHIVPRSKLPLEQSGSQLFRHEIIFLFLSGRPPSWAVSENSAKQTCSTKRTINLKGLSWHKLSCHKLEFFIGSETWYIINLFRLHYISIFYCYETSV